MLCVCQKVTDVFILLYFAAEVDMIECGNIGCKRGRWFHPKCLTLDVCPGEDDEWFCSEECENSGSSAWCVCRQKRDEQLMACAAKDDCIRGRYFHPTCVGYVPELEKKGMSQCILCNMQIKRIFCF